MSAGKISLWFSRTNLHLVFLANGSPSEFIQPPNNQWSPKNRVPNPDQIVFQAVKLVQGIGSTVMLIGLDTTGPNNTGRLWFTTSNDNGGWAPNFVRLPNSGAIDFARFDATIIPFIGIVLAAVSNGVAYTQTTPDGVNWSQPGWSNQPTSPILYSFRGQFGTQPPVPYQPPWPPPLSNLVLGDNGDVHEGDNAPILAGLANVNGETLPLALYNDSTNSNWQWSEVPTLTETITSRGHQVTIHPPPYPAGVGIADIYFGEVQGIFGPILLLLGTDGNVYFMVAANGGISNWTYYSQGALPNPTGLSFNQAKAAVGFVINSNGFGNLQVVAINSGDLFPYLIWHNGSVPDLTQGNWNWAGQLPVPNPAPQVVDFDIAMGSSALQVAYLTKNGSVYINFQVQGGGWGVFDGPH